MAQDLNRQQQAAVDHRQGPAIVLAGPGAGKTKVLTARAAALIQDGVMPERILLLTFTRAAAKTMTRRARAIDERAEFVSSGTFHSWAIKLINANAHVFGRDKPFTVLDQEDAYELIKKAMEPLKDGGDNWPRASTVNKMISYSINTNRAIEDVIRERHPDYQDLSELIEEVAANYAESKLDRGLIDYDDVLTYVAILLEDEEIGHQIRSQYDQVMIDEYQDTNELQLRVVNGLSGKNNAVMIVGDPGQAIYSFRGSAPATMQRFLDQYPMSKVYNLEINYRSSDEIIEVVNVIDHAMDIGFERDLKSARGPSGHKPRIIEVTDNTAEAVAIADAILEDKSNGGEISDHAILVRSTASARRIEAEFITRKIPHRVLGGTRIDEAAHIRDLLSIARLITNLTHEPAWLRMLSRFRRIGEKAANNITQRIMADQQSGNGQLMGVEHACNTLRDEARQRKSDLDLLAHALEVMNRSGDIADRLHAVIETMTPLWSAIWADDWKARARDLDAMTLIAEEHATLESFLTTVTLDASIDREKPGNIDADEEPPVTVSTIHSAKGLEWKHVHVPAFVAGGMPSMFANRPEEHDEEMRVFYVAASRAEKHLSFYKPRLNNQGNFTAPSPYEAMIARHVEYQRNSATPSHAAPGKLQTSKRIDLRSKLVPKKD